MRKQNANETFHRIIDEPAVGPGKLLERAQAMPIDSERDLEQFSFEIK